MRRFPPIMANNSYHVAEMQGLYGPFTIAERVVQKIWLRGDFDHRCAQGLLGWILERETRASG